LQSLYSDVNVDVKSEADLLDKEFLKDKKPAHQIRTPIEWIYYIILVKRQKISSSFGPDAHRVNGTCNDAISSSNRLFCPEQKLQVQQALIMNGLTCTGLLLKFFQRPMLKWRAYYKGAMDGQTAQAMFVGS
jgi:hypothetical protein